MRLIATFDNARDRQSNWGRFWGKEARMDNASIVQGENESQLARGVALSRRRFIELSVGTIVMLPAAPGGFLSPFEAEQAYAAENVANTTKIIIAKSYEAGFIVADMTDGKKVPVAGANVTITSQFNKKKLSGTTDSSGRLIVDIRDLAKKETVDGVARYSFYAQVDVEAQGYRKFRTHRVSVEGARGVLLPTRKLSGEMIYPVAISFDGWDVLYTKNEFAVTDANDEKHTLRIDLATGLYGPITLRLVHNETKKVVAQASGVEAKHAEASAELTNFFLLATHESTFPSKGTYHLEMLQGSGTYTVPTGLSTCSAPTGATKASSTKMYLSPFNTGTMKPQIEIPKSIPVIGGDKIQVWTPDLDVDVMFNPFGYFKIAYKSEEIGYKSKNGEPDPNAWKSHPRKTFAEQWKKNNEAREKMMKSVGDAKRREGVFKKAGFTSNLSATAMFAGMLAGRWGEDSGLWRGLLGVQGTLAFDFSYAQQFMAGPIPIVVEFGFNAGITLALTVAVSTPEIFTPSKYRMDYVNTGISLTIPISLSLSLGLGIKGTLTLSIQGVAAFTLFVNCGPLPSNATKEMTNPHVVLGLKVQANVVAQALIFTVTHTLWEWNKPAFHDNWKPKLTGQSDLEAQDDGNESWDTIFGNVDDMAIITEESLGEGSEFEIAWETKEVDGALTEDQVDEYGEDEDAESWLYWGDCLSDEADEDSYWLDIDDDDEEGDNTSGFVFNADGSVSGWGTWDDIDDDSLDGQSLSAQSDDDDALASAPKLERHVVQCVTDDGIPYQMTAFTVSGAKASSTPSAKAQAAEESKKQEETASAATPTLSTQATENPSSSLQSDDTTGLSAQSEDEPKLSAQTEVRHFRHCSVKSKPNKIAGDGMAVKRPRAAAPMRIASDTGLVPQCDTKIIQSVFSDPRTKVVKLYESSYLFRIAAVDIKGSNGATLKRTRIVAQKIVGAGETVEPMRVLDFKHTYEQNPSLDRLNGRDDLFDYDFDIRVRTGAEGSYITELDLFIISGKRANGNSTTIGQAASDQVFTHAICQFTLTNQKLEIKYGFSVKTSDPAFAATGNSAHTYHNFSCPHIIETAKGEYVATYLDRAAASPDKVLSNDAASVGLGVCFTTRYGNMKAANVSSLIAAADPITDASIYEMITLERIKVEKGSNKSETSWIPIMLRGQSKTYHYLLKTEATSVYDKLDRPAAQVRSLMKLNVADANGNVPTRLVSWPGRSAVLASLGGKLVKGTLVNPDSSPSLSFEEVGPSNFSTSAFGTDKTGHFIYWPACEEGSPGFSYENAADDPEKAESLPEVTHHRIMACKLRNGKFSDPFVFAEVAHDMDTLEVIGSQQNEAMAFVSCDLTEATKGKADIWYTSLPNVRCANITGVEALSEIAYPGEPMTLNLTVRNDGNTFLAGFTAKVRERSNAQTVAEVKVVFKDAIIESGFNPADEKGKLQNVEDDFSLPPGKSSVYQIKVDVPSSWTGEKSMSVVAEDTILAGSSSVGTQSLSAQADDDDYSFDDSDAIEYLVGTSEDDYSDDGIPFDIIEVQYEDDLDDYDEGYDDEFGDAAVTGSGGESESGNGSGSDSTTRSSTYRSSTAKTADPLGIASGVLAAAAAAGAAMTAYSARRIANERAESNAESDEEQ